tara:strand:+ start:3674 stop:4450 length:777 start_codon:yes stop_codon:yes gene_type:complete
MWFSAATFSGAAILSLLVLRRLRCRLFIVNLRRSSWTDVLLFLPPATVFFMPVACGGVDYPLEYSTSLVPMVVGAVAVVTLVARSNRSGLGPDPRPPHIRNLHAAVRLPTLAVFQTVALWTLLCAVLPHLRTPEPTVDSLGTATDVDSWKSMLTILSVAAAASFVATAILRWGARVIVMLSSCGIRILLMLGVVTVSSLLCLGGDSELRASTPAALRRSLTVFRSRALLATAQSVNGGVASDASVASIVGHEHDLVLR